jgi:amino acid transporter
MTIVILGVAAVVETSSSCQKNSWLSSSIPETIPFSCDYFHLPSLHNGIAANELTPWNSVLVTLTVVQLSLPTGTYLEPDESSTRPHAIVKDFIFQNSLVLSFVLQNSFEASDQNFVFIPLLSYICYISNHSHHAWFVRSYWIWRITQEYESPQWVIYSVLLLLLLS